ncbi:MAG TPA: transaminase [Candidatus Limnocylindrales bacterium]|nr:transaminase [Candidatus Limnocylindrales bacterium]
MTVAAPIDRVRLAERFGAETEAFARAHPRCAEAASAGRRTLLMGVPMPWMAKWASPFPPVVAEASGARFTCLDGLEFSDLCLGDTGAMAGHSPAPTVAAVEAQLGRGITHMLPTEDAAAVGAELERRFGPPLWQFTLSATDANRFAIRLARHVTGRSKVAFHDRCYHGSVDESFAVLDDAGRVVARRGNTGPPVDPALTTRVVPFNDVAALEAALADEDVAVVVMEPALTNVGIVLPDPGYHDAVRDLTRKTGTLLLIDETHTLCAGWGGYTRAHALDPDIVVVGKAIAGGIPIGAYGLTAGFARRATDSIELEDVDVGGIGGTLAGNALSLAAARATLSDVLTPEAFERMDALATRWTADVNVIIERHALPWHVTRLGCRAEYHFLPSPPRTGAEQAAATDFPLERYLHLAVLNRGVLITPFHNMALMSPATVAEDVERHSSAFAEAVELLLG